MPSQVPNEKFGRFLDVSGGEQVLTSRFLYKQNELTKTRNVDLLKKIGAATRRDGYEQVGFPVQDGSPITGLMSFFRSDGFDLLSAANNSGGTNTDVRYNAYNTHWINVITDFPAGAKVHAVDFGGLDETFVVAYSEGLGQYGITTVIKKDRTTTRTLDVVNAPRGATISKYGDRIIIGNVEINGKRYSNRAYISSLPTKVITVVNGSVNTFAWRLQVDDAKYLYPGMRIDIYRGGTAVKVKDSLEIVTVDKRNNFITFAGQNISVLDNDEIYLEDQRDNFRIFWDIDGNDFLFIPPEGKSIPEITWIDEDNNRALIWTFNSFWKFDGANLIPISKTIGCRAPETVKKLGNGWIVWTDGSSVWAYNDTTGQLQKISRGVDAYLRASQIPVSEWGAGGLDDIYVLSIGPITTSAAGDLTIRETTTSTSSTSTSSTSSSTSSTSTSSTSTSSTVTGTTTSTSSTSSSTSSTSSSTSTSSTSTSTTSTSSTTAASTRQSYVLKYYFNLNAWTVDRLDRDIKVSTVHRMNGKTHIYFGDETGRVYRWGVGLSDNGRSIPWEIETVRYDDGRPEILKHYREIYVYTEQGESASLYIRFDGKGDWVPLVQLNDGSNRVRPRDEKMRGQPLRGHDFQLKLTQNDTGEPCYYLGCASYYTDEQEI